MNITPFLPSVGNPLSYEKERETFAIVSTLGLRRKKEGKANCLKEKYVASGVFMVYIVLKDKTQNDVNKFVSHYKA